MAQTGFTPIQIYRSSTASAAPTSSNLVAGELAINTADGKLFYLDNLNAVQVIGWKLVPVSAGGTGTTTSTGTGSVVLNSSPSFSAGASFGSNISIVNTEFGAGAGTNSILIGTDAEANAEYDVVMGFDAFKFNTGGGDGQGSNTIIGSYAANTSFNTYETVIIGANILTNGQGTEASVYLGTGIVGTADSYNEIVIGAYATGSGSNTTTIGKSSTTNTYLKGAVTAGSIINTRITPRVSTTASSATPTINTDNTDQFGLTAQAVDITSFTTNLSGTPTNGQKLWIYIVGTAARAITWGASFESSTATLPTTTVTTNRLDIGFVWNAATSKWRCVAVA